MAALGPYSMHPGHHQMTERPYLAVPSCVSVSTFLRMPRTGRKNPTNQLVIPGIIRSRRTELLATHRRHQVATVSQLHDDNANDQIYVEEQQWSREEQRWLREEQRWLREEQRWLREEVRWQEERSTYAKEIDHLKSALLSIYNARTQEIGGSGIPFDEAFDAEVVFKLLAGTSFFGESGPKLGPRFEAMRALIPASPLASGMETKSGIAPEEVDDLDEEEEQEVQADNWERDAIRPSPSSGAAQIAADPWSSNPRDAEPSSRDLEGVPMELLRKIPPEILAQIPIEILRNVPPADIIAAVNSKSPGGSGNLGASMPPPPAQEAGPMTPAGQPQVSSRQPQFSSGQPQPSSGQPPFPPGQQLPHSGQSPKFSGQLQQKNERRQRVLKVNTEGEDVKEMQEALLALGFYCGEEEMDDGYFGDGTASAVKTWQSTIGAQENGILSVELLNILLGQSDAPPPPPRYGSAPPPYSPPPSSYPPPSSSSYPSSPYAPPPYSTYPPSPYSSYPPSPSAEGQGPPGGSRGPVPTQDIGDSAYRAPRATVDQPEIERYARTDIEEGEGVRPRRVFLLGENRWEDPERMTPSTAGRGGGGGRAGQQQGRGGRGRGGRGPVSMQQGQRGMAQQLKCFQCRGEGTTLCMECDGTGELNVEEQFADWAGDEPKCLYCGGTGAVPCDLCDGRGSTK